jgi:transcriptional regulator with XRE-family HTH domain
MNAGKRIRDSRIAAGMTIQDVSEASGFSRSYVSQVERGTANPSLSALSRIAVAVDLEVSDLFSVDGTESSTTSQAAGSTTATEVVRHDHRKELIHPSSHLRYELLCPDLQHSLQVHKTTAPVGVRITEHISHPGEELGVVLRGKIEITVGDETFTLETGDSIRFDGNKPHLWTNVGEEELEMMWIITPPHF